MLRRRLVRVGRAVLTIHLVLTAALALIVVGPSLATGWDPVLVTEATLDPALGTGDVVLFDDLGERRLVLPLAGLPFVWLERGDVLLFGLWAASIVGSAFVLVRSWLRRSRRRRMGPIATDVADAAIRRLRLVFGLLVLGQLAIDPGALDPTGDPVVVVLAAGLVLAAASLLSLRAPGARFRVPFELVADGVVVVLLAAPAGAGPLLWVLLALPIIEATARYRLAGAVIAWTTVSLATIQVRAVTSSAPDVVADELLPLLDQLGILFLIALPVSFLAEQLLVDIVGQRDAELSAVERSELLHVVAEAGQRVSTVDLELMQTVVETTESLGFDRCDVVVRSDGRWRVVGESATGGPLPAATTAAGGLIGHEMSARTEVDDVDEHAGPALRRLGLGRVLVHRLSDSPLAALRVGVAADRMASSEQLEALDLLVAQARVALQNELLVTELRSAREALEKQALTDALTGLPNRGAFHRYLAERTAATDPGPGCFAVLFCDLDGFKAVNDEMGHDAGDALLIEVSRRLTDLADGDDLVARLGGDEFVVLATRPDRIGLEVLAADIVRAVGEPVHLGGRTALVGASVGLAEGEPGLDDDDLVRRADAAMYAVKASGKRSWRRFDLTLAGAPRRSLQLRSDILAAIRRDELRLEYQPVVSARKGPLQIVLAEALLRWHHPQFGRIGPLDTLATADDAGNRDEVEEWVLRKACTDAARWQIPGGPPVPVAVNLSPVQLRRPELVQIVTTALAGTGLSPESLVLELSEEAAIDHRDVTAGLHELRDRGVSLALDDFGTGDASITTLRSVELDVLKLDKSFVDRCESVETERKILGAIATLAQGLGLIVIAEGVERREQLEIVRSLDIELVQGYLAYRPLDVDAFRAALARQREGRDERPTTPEPAARR